MVGLAGRAIHERQPEMHLSLGKEGRMKPPTVFMGEMTSPEVEAYMARAAAQAGGPPTVIVPTGSTEQHGPHGALLTDMIIAQEVARRAAPSVGVGALVAPS